MVSSQPPLPVSDRATGEGKTKSIQKTGSNEGSTSENKSMQNGPAPHATSHGEKDHDRGDPDTLPAARLAANNSGHSQPRATQPEAIPTSLHAPLTAETAGGARITGRFDGANDAKPATEPQESTTMSWRDAANSHLPDGTALPVTVNTARLVQRIQESEISLNVRSADFGNVAIHTAMSHERVSAQISLEHLDLGKAISSEVSALQSKLSQEHGVQASIEVQQQGQSFFGNGGQPQQQAWRQPTTVAPLVGQQASQADMVPSAVNDDGRLDVRV